MQKAAGVDTLQKEAGVSQSVEVGSVALEGGMVVTLRGAGAGVPALVTASAAVSMRQLDTRAVGAEGAAMAVCVQGTEGVRGRPWRRAPALNDAATRRCPPYRCLRLSTVCAQIGLVPRFTRG